MKHAEQPIKIMLLSEILANNYSDKATHHRYGPLYDRLLTPYKDSARVVLELGIENGCSLRAWREFFTNAEIIGLEKEPHKLFQDFRISTYRCDTTERDATLELVANLPKIDVICDDGSHVLTEQIFAVCALWPKLKSGGIMIVEDIYKPEYLPLFKAFNAELYDLRVEGGCADDLVAVIRKP